MGRQSSAAPIILALGIGLGFLLGDATVSAMQVRRTLAAAPPREVRTSEFDRGRLWAVAHPRPTDARACPQASLLFLIGCLAAP